MVDLAVVAAEAALHDQNAVVMLYAGLDVAEVQQVPLRVQLGFLFADVVQQLQVVQLEVLFSAAATGLAVLVAVAVERVIS